ncbi:hypothetical protein LWI29_036935 [Acer saccharum]|uniref:MULE transposase domain-containing protein n=1 Tax=Acer saccharum TaxID=4024 RepID=A0AA39W1Q9_ACESA|nr:hypothetical protein LWI29_036935 [Acer saccharum]
MLVSDQHNGIFNAMEAIFPNATHGVCAYHLAQNLKRFCKQRNDVIWLYYGLRMHTVSRILIVQWGLGASFNADGDGDGDGDKDNDDLVLLLPLPIFGLLLFGFAISHGVEFHHLGLCVTATAMATRTTTTRTMMTL